MDEGLGLTNAQIVLEGSREGRFTINDDGTLEALKSTYDMNAVNAYIVNIQEQARKSNEHIYKQALERGRYEGYKETLRRERSNEGQFYFLGTKNLTIKVCAGVIEVMEFDSNGNQILLEQISQKDMMKINKQLEEV